MTALPNLAGPDPSILVRRASEGDERAFEALYRMFAPQVYALSLRMTRSPAAAEDALQEVFLRAWRSLGRFRGDSAFGTWLHRIAVRVLIDHNRAARPDDPATDADFGAVAPAGTNLDIERAVGALPERARLVMLLTIAGHRYDEIAEIMDIEVGTVKAQLHRARRLMREALQ